MMRPGFMPLDTPTMAMRARLQQAPSLCERPRRGRRRGRPRRRAPSTSSATRPPGVDRKRVDLELGERVGHASRAERRERARPLRQRVDAQLVGGRAALRLGEAAARTGSACSARGHSRSADVAATDTTAVGAVRRMAPAQHLGVDAARAQRDHRPEVGRRGAGRAAARRRARSCGTNAADEEAGTARTPANRAPACRRRRALTALDARPSTTRRRRRRSCAATSRRRRP